MPQLPRELGKGRSQWSSQVAQHGCLDAAFASLDGAWTGDERMKLSTGGHERHQDRAGIAGSAQGLTEEGAHRLPAAAGRIVVRSSRKRTEARGGGQWAVAPERHILGAWSVHRFGTPWAA